MTLTERIYPEKRFGGFTRYDGTVAFYSRARALADGARSVLIVGCGRGKFTDDPCDYRRNLQSFQRPGVQVTGIDVDPDAAVNSTIDRFVLIGEDMAWPLESDSVDFACGDFVLEHVADPKAFFSELARVLKAGATACFRTPNKFCYIAMVSQLIPNSMHAKVLSRVQDRRNEKDIFPTVYKCNTKRALRRWLNDDFDFCILRQEAEPGYLGFNTLLYRLGAWVHALMPPWLKSTLLVYARRKGSLT